MKLGCSQEALGHFARYFFVPFCMYLLAAICWVWLSGEDGTLSQSLASLVTMLVLVIHWVVLRPEYGLSVSYRIAVYLIPLVVGISGVTAMYMV